MTTILENTYVSQAWFSYVNVPLFTWHIDILQLVKHLLSWNEWLMGSFGCVKSVYRFCGIASLSAVVFLDESFPLQICRAKGWQNFRLPEMIVNYF